MEMFVLLEAVLYRFRDLLGSQNFALTVVCWLKKILLTTPYQSFANRAKLVVEGIENHTKSRNQQTTAKWSGRSNCELSHWITGVEFPVKNRLNSL